jgi:regulatory protein
MAAITALTPQKRNPKRVSVFLDGHFAFGLPDVVAAGLRIGQTLDEAEMAALQDAATLEAARQRALRIISLRPRSAAEVRRNLTDHGFDEAVIGQVEAWLGTVNLLDDEAFAAYWVEQRETFRPRGAQALRQELRQKGVSADQIEAAVSELDELESARRAIGTRAERWRALDDVAFRAKIGRYLQARGFGYDVIRQVSRELQQNDTEAE